MQKECCFGDRVSWISEVFIGWRFFAMLHSTVSIPKYYFKENLRWAYSSEYLVSELLFTFYLRYFTFYLRYILVLL